MDGATAMEISRIYSSFVYTSDILQLNTEDAMNKTWNKTCKECNCELNESNVVKSYKKAGSGYRTVCKACRVKEVVKWQVGNPKRMAYANAYARKIGRVKEYPCETCGKPCYKKYAKALCSDMCRFMHYVIRKGDCWIWSGAKNHQGYGKTHMNNNEYLPAHRMSYLLFKGEIPEGMFVCHQCDNRSCVKPAHLWLGTHMENMIDMVEKDRQSSKLTAQDVYDIRRFSEEPREYTNKQLTEMYDVAAATISNIVARRTWKHI